MEINSPTCTVLWKMVTSGIKTNLYLYSKTYAFLEFLEWVFCFFTTAKYNNECSTGEFDLIEEIKNLTCLCLQFVASFLNFRRSKILLAHTVSVKILSSLLVPYIWKKKKIPKTSKRVWLQFSVEGSSIFAVISLQERPHNYTNKFSTDVCITASILTSLLCLSVVWISYTCLLWFVLLLSIIYV